MSDTNYRPYQHLYLVFEDWENDGQDYSPKRFYVSYRSCKEHLGCKWYNLQAKEGYVYGGVGYDILLYLQEKNPVEYKLPFRKEDIQNYWIKVDPTIDENKVAVREDTRQFSFICDTRDREKGYKEFTINLDRFEDRLDEEHFQKRIEERNLIPPL